MYLLQLTLTLHLSYGTSPILLPVFAPVVYCLPSFTCEMHEQVSKDAPTRPSHMVKATNSEDSRCNLDVQIELPSYIRPAVASQPASSPNDLLQLEASATADMYLDTPPAMSHQHESEGPATIPTDPNQAGSSNPDSVIRTELPLRQPLDLRFDESSAEQAEAAADPPSSTHLSSGTACPLIMDGPLAEDKQAATAVVDVAVTASKSNATAVAAYTPVTADGPHNVITEQGFLEAAMNGEPGGEMVQADDTEYRMPAVAAPAADDNAEVSLIL